MPLFRIGAYVPPSSFVVPDIASSVVEVDYSHSDILRCRTRASTVPVAPWSTTYKAAHDLNVAAGKSTALLSVTDNPGTGNPRQWATDQPYAPGTETYVSTSERYDYEVVGLKLSRLCNALAMEWLIVGDTVAADKCVALLYHHLGDPVKSLDMTVKADGNLSRNVEIYNTHVGIFRALGLVWGYSGWTAPQKTQINTALDQFITTHAPYSSSSTTVDTNNIDIWRGAARAAAAAIRGNNTAIAEEADHLTDRLNVLQHASSSFWTAERLRDRGIFYVMYAQMAATHLARIAELNLSRDLWTETLGSAGGIEACFDAMVVVLNRSNPVAYWEGTLGYSEIEATGPIAKGTMQVEAFEYAYNRWGKSTYAQVINRYQRPFPGQYSSHNATFYIGSTTL